MATNTCYAFDVTALVNSYIASGQNAGFFIKARTESDNYIAFYGLSATNTATRPKLEITAAPPPTTGLFTGSQVNPFALQAASGRSGLFFYLTGDKIFVD